MILENKLNSRINRELHKCPVIGVIVPMFLSHHLCLTPTRRTPCTQNGTFSGADLRRRSTAVTVNTYRTSIRDSRYRSITRAILPTHHWIESGLSNRASSRSAPETRLNRAPLVSYSKRNVFSPTHREPGVSFCEMWICVRVRCRVPDEQCESPRSVGPERPNVWGSACGSLSTAAWRHVRSWRSPTISSRSPTLASTW